MKNSSHTSKDYLKLAGKVGFPGWQYNSRSDTPTFTKNNQQLNFLTNNPQHCLGFLVIEKHGFIVEAMGALISERHVLTAAHNVLGKKSKKLCVLEELKFRAHNGSTSTIRKIFIDESLKESW